MTGNLLITEPSAVIAKHTHVILRLESGMEIRFVDPRRFGRLSVVRGHDHNETASGFIGPGTEPLTISLDDFVKLFRGRKTPIKAALLNQKLLHGVGNIYADESLFRAGIRPRRRAGALSREQLAGLRRGLKTVLRQAIKAGGSSVSDYVDSNGEEGLFQLKHYVYLRTGEPCRKCGTPIKRMLLAGRGTHFCPNCQK
jgi:formamidopyrimidine-DNA glycosylase